MGDPVVTPTLPTPLACASQLLADVPADSTAAAAAFL